MEQANNQPSPKPAKSLDLKKLLLFLSVPVVVAVVAIVALYLNQPAALSDNAAQVEISAAGFVPQTLKVKKVR